MQWKHARIWAESGTYVCTYVVYRVVYMCCPSVFKLCYYITLRIQINVCLHAPPLPFA